MSVVADPRDAVELPHALALSIAGVPVRVLTNDVDVWTRLRLYYNPWVVTTSGTDALLVRLIHDGSVTGGAGFTDVVRGDGKKVKEAVREADGERLVLKRTTGVLMGLRRGILWARGDLRSNLNQAINLVNHAYAKVVLGRGHLLLHASAVSWNGRAAALAGPPGAGKSTTALHLVEAGYRFVSNDRLLVKPLQDRVEALGYPKQPRVNPGTLVSHPRLRRRLSMSEMRELKAMDPAALWELERKSDVDLDSIYTPGTIELRADLRALVLLRWRRDDRGLSIRRLTLDEALAAVPLIHKDLGVFDLDRPLGVPSTPDPERYAALLSRLTVVEVTGATRADGLGAVVGELIAR